MVEEWLPHLCHMKRHILERAGIIGVGNPVLDVLEEKE
jgi:hypothetical protein